MKIDSNRRYTSYMKLLMISEDFIIHKKSKDKKKIWNCIIQMKIDY